MGARRRAREYALQVLFQLDLGKEKDGQALLYFWEQNKADEEVKEFCERLVKGVRENLPEIDKLITNFSTNWKLSRMAMVDRNVLRMATFELMHCPDIPEKVTLNEAIEIAKRFGSEDSGAFVNGIIDKIAKTVKK